VTEPLLDVKVVDCEEYGQIDIDTSLWLGEGHEAILNSEIDGKDVLRANFSKGMLRLQATSFVGVIPLNDRVILRVKPRVPLGNLTRMVIDTGHSVLALSAFRDYAGRGTADDWVMDRYADALLDYIDSLLDKGLLRSYERHDDEGHFPHGRVDFTRTIQRFAARGVPNKVAYSWHERTVDTPSNRCIKAAMAAVQAHLSKARTQPRRGDRAKLARLAGQFLAFEDVAEDPDHRFLEDPQVLGLTPLPDPRSYYHPTLSLSVLILQGTGIALDLGGRDVQMGSLLIDTNDLFENFVRVSLARYAAEHSWTVDVLDGNTEGKVDLYDIPVELPAPFGTPLEAAASRDPGKAQPDVVLRSLDGGYPLIAEVKNTIAKDSALPTRSHVEQAVTYALRYGLDFTLLIHPWSQGTRGLLYIGRVRSIDVYDYRLDLSSESTVDEALTDLANCIAQLAGLSTPGPT
jgi:5-methylcytosine-specific restriction enzyme subunit McrC